MQDEISISKEVLQSLDEDVFQKTSLGDPQGAIRQYRSVSGVHVREYADRFIVHMDYFDPRTAPIAHLLVDSPESVLGFGVASLLSQCGRDEHPNSSFSFFPFVFAFLSFNHLFRALKHLVFR